VRSPAWWRRSGPAPDPAAHALFPRAAAGAGPISSGSRRWALAARRTRAQRRRADLRWGKPKAAGRASGRAELVGALPRAGAPPPVRGLAPFTPDLKGLVAWRVACGSATGVLESEGGCGLPIAEVRAHHAIPPLCAPHARASACRDANPTGMLPSGANARSDSAVGAYYRAMRVRLGPGQAIVATAHKIARIVYHLLKTGEPYRAEGATEDAQQRQAGERNHRARRAQKRGSTVAPIPARAPESQPEGGGEGSF